MLRYARGVVKNLILSSTIARDTRICCLNQTLVQSPALSSSKDSNIGQSFRAFGISIKKPLKSLTSQAKKLRTAIRAADEEYYGGKAELKLTDAEYDALYKQLEQLETEFPELKTSDSPTQLVGSAKSLRTHSKTAEMATDASLAVSASVSKLGDTLPHSFPMLSVTSMFEPREISLFVKNVIKASRQAGLHGLPVPKAQKALTFFVELKFDGVAIALRYVKGKLVLALTRGDGKDGQLLLTDHLENYLPGVPRALDEGLWQKSLLGTLADSVDSHLSTTLRRLAHHIEIHGPLGQDCDWIDEISRLYPTEAKASESALRELERADLSRLLRIAGQSAHEGDHIEVRGECIMPRDAFEAYSQALQACGRTRYTSPRNLASGLFHRDRESIREEYGDVKMLPQLKLVAYSLSFPSLDTSTSSGAHRTPRTSKSLSDHPTPVSWLLAHSQRIALLRSALGFDIDPLAERVELPSPNDDVDYDSYPDTLAAVHPAPLPSIRASTSELIKSDITSDGDVLLQPASPLDPLLAAARARLQARAKLAVDCDGTVIKVDSFATQMIMGNTSRAVRWAAALKENRSSAVARLVSVALQVGRTGRVTPVATITPTEMQGATVTRASLHNCDMLRDLKVAIEDEVVIERRGDIIPTIVDVVRKPIPSNEQQICRSVWDTLPRDAATGSVLCPCELKLPLESELALRASDGKRAVGLFCVQPAHKCPSQRVRQLEHFCSKDAGIAIDGLGPAVLERLLNEAKLITGCPSSIVRLGFDSDVIARLNTFVLGAKGMGPKQAMNIVTAVRTAVGAASADRFLSALGLTSLGPAQSTRILNHLFEKSNHASFTALSVDQRLMVGLEELFYAYTHSGVDGLNAALTGIPHVGPSTVKVLSKELAEVIDTSLTSMLPYAASIPAVQALQAALHRVGSSIPIVNSSGTEAAPSISTPSIASTHISTAPSMGGHCTKLKDRIIVITGQFASTGADLLELSAHNNEVGPVLKNVLERRGIRTDEPNSLKPLTRDDVAAMIKVCGGECVDSVTKRVTDVVEAKGGKLATRASGSSKSRRARELNIPLHDEAGLWKILLN